MSRCKNCNSPNTTYDHNYGFWQCKDCSTVWGSDIDDPDYDDPEICPQCKGLGLKLDSALTLPCPFCAGTGYDFTVK